MLHEGEREGGEREREREGWCYEVVGGMKERLTSFNHGMTQSLW